MRRATRWRVPMFANFASRTCRGRQRFSGQDTRIICAGSDRWRVQEWRIYGRFYAIYSGSRLGFCPCCDGELRVDYACYCAVSSVVEHYIDTEGKTSTFAKVSQHISICLPVHLPIADWSPTGPFEVGRPKELKRGGSRCPTCAQSASRGPIIARGLLLGRRLESN